MKRLLPALPLVALLGLAACHPQTQPATTATAPPTTAGTPAAGAAGAPAVANSPGAQYRVFRGRLPGQADSITLHLVTAPQPRYDNRGLSHSGNYYGANGHPYEVQSLHSAPDSVVLNDVSLEHNDPGTNQNGPVWRLRQQPGGGLVGTADGQPLRLRLLAPAATGGLTFAVRCLADSLAAHPNKAAASPKARISLQALLPVGGPPALAADLLRELHGDTLDGGRPVPALPALFAQQRDTLFARYRADVADTPAGEGSSATLNYDDQAAVSVLFQQGNLLSVGVFSYSYSGGAHGMNSTSVASYDLRTGRRLRYPDIFLPTAKARLPALLERAVRPLMRLKPSEPLSETLLVAQMPVTTNVYLTAGGAVFVYTPYEIASYAAGEIRVFVPLAQLRSLLREGLPLPGAASVAAR